MDLKDDTAPIVSNIEPESEEDFMWFNMMVDYYYNMF